MGEFLAYKKEDGTRDAELGTESNITYYRTILSRAFNETYFVPSEDVTKDKIGIINLHPLGLPDEEAVRERIAEEEAKYKFQWSDGEKVKSPDGKPILNELERVNVLDYWDNYGTEKGYFDKKVQNQIKVQELTITLTKEPLKFSRGSEDDKLLVTVQETATALYTDTAKNTQNYKYKLVGESYVAVKTWIPEEAGAAEAKRAEYYYKADEDLRSRFHQRAIAIAKNGRKGVPNIGSFCTINKSYKDWKDGVEEEALKSIKAAADDAAKLIPVKPHMYSCYYYSSGSNLEGFVAWVNFGGNSSDGSGGYSGRADRVTEVDYRWVIVPKPDTEDFKLATVLSNLIGLDNARLLPGVKEAGAEYHPTNVPNWIDKKSENPTGRVPVLFRYFKKFLPDKERKNEPKEEPMKPRLVKRPLKNPGADKSLRKWKKGLALDGETLGFGNKSTRSTAGIVMANALRGFNFFDAAEKAYPGVIKMSTLPATAYAKHVIATDASVQEQWKIDNELTAIGLRTEQEWCHLYGHGDGGQETLDNFVSGSEHCNTEQLAIEKGQRRVSQYKAIPEDIRKKLTWRITAEVFPNLGSAYKEPDLKKFKKYLEALGDRKDKVKAYFFKDGQADLELKSDPEVRSGLTSLAADISEARRTYRKAIATDKDAAQKEVESLVTFQRGFLSECYIYHPLGRFVRYRIFFGGHKCFEHYFDAQSQSFDVNEGKILDYTVEYAIYLAMQKAKVVIELKTKDKDNNPIKRSALEFYEEIIARRTESFDWSTEEEDLAKEIMEELEEMVLIEKEPIRPEEKIEKKKVRREKVKKSIRDYKPKDKKVNKNLKKTTGDLTRSLDHLDFDETQSLNKLKRQRSASINIKNFRRKSS